MLPIDNKTFVRRYLEAISKNEKPMALVRHFVADTDEALQQHIIAGEIGFPRYELIAEDLVAEDDKVVVRFTLRGVHLGEFMGIPATDKTVAVPGIIIYRIAEGKIVEHWMQMDSTTLLQQLGV